MAAEWRKAPKEVIEIAERLIATEHPTLLDCRIRFLMRSEAPKRGNGMVVYGKAKKISDEMKTLLPFEFVIWLADDVFANFSALQRTALIDHELTHCVWNMKKRAATMRPHDFEEFNSIIAKYGLWWPASDETAVAIQAHLPLGAERRGGVEAIDARRFMHAVADEMEGKAEAFAGMDEDDDSPFDDRPFPTTAVDA